MDVKQFAERVAMLRKERMLWQTPCADSVMVKLNRHPTWDETRAVERFFKDIEECGGKVQLPSEVK